MSTYSDKLKDPRWQKKRLLILDRDLWMCQVCNDSEKTLHVHHKTYSKGKEPWDYDDSNFITLCENCHKEETSLREEYEEKLLCALRMTNFTYRDLDVFANCLSQMQETHVRDVVFEVLYKFIKDPIFQRAIIDKYLNDLVESSK